MIYYYMKEKLRKTKFDYILDLDVSSLLDQ